MNRKEFIQKSSLAAFSVSMFSTISKDADGRFSSECVTTNDILGPFYRPLAPIRSNLIFDGLQGVRITLTGKVYDEDCKTPLENALVEIWHCNTEGEYDNESTEFRHRASWKTNQHGEYNFTTILPGKYLNGELYRPSHIHYRVTHEKSKDMISQIYFEGDPHIHDDPWASQPKAKLRTLKLTPVDIHGNLNVEFDIYLDAK